MPAVLIWIGCVFVSILVHEFGHGLMAKRFQGSPSSCFTAWEVFALPASRRYPGQRLAVLFAGPGAGFVLFGLVLVATSLVFG